MARAPVAVGLNMRLPGPHCASACSKARRAASQLSRGGTAYGGIRELQYTLAETSVKQEERSNKTNILRWDDKLRKQYRKREDKDCGEEEPKGNHCTASHVGKRHMP